MSLPATLAILQRALGRLPEAGQEVDLPIDLAVMGGAAGPETAQIFNSRGGVVWDAARVAMTIDFPAPGVEGRVPRCRGVCREFASRHHLRHVYDVNLGIGAQVLLELGLVTPGQVIVGCGRCLHQLGAVGALVIGAGPGVLARSLHTGKLPLKIPAVARLLFEGSAGDRLGAFDLGLLAGEALASLSAETAVEFAGKPVEALDVDGRVTLVELGAEAHRSGIVAADAVTAAFLAERMETPPHPAPAATPEGYATTLTVDLAGREPLVQGPGPGGPLRPVSDLKGKKIHSAFIGSCASGRYRDLMAAAAILKRGKRIHPEVRLSLAPATLGTAQMCLAAGIYETFFQVGAMLAVPGSSPGMAGGGALFGEGEVILSTAPYNSPLSDAGRGPEVYRASPATVAASAIAGEIRDASEL